VSVKIRLQRKGKKKYPVYRFVVSDSRCHRDGKVLEVLGQYNPNHEPSLIECDKERMGYWFSQGAQASDPILRLFKNDNVLPAKQLSSYNRRVDAKMAASKAKREAEKKQAEKEAKAAEAAKKAEEAKASDADQAS